MIINLLGTSTPQKMQWNLWKYLWYDKYLAYDLSDNIHYTIYILLNQPQHRNTTTTGHGVFQRTLHPMDPSTIWCTLNIYCHNLVQSMTATASQRHTYAYALQIEDFNYRLLRFVTYSNVMQYIWLDPL